MINKSTIDDLKSIINDLNVPSGYQEGGRAPYYYSNLLSFRDAISTLIELDLFTNDISELRKTKLFNDFSLSEYSWVSKDDRDKIDKLLNSLHYKALGVIEAFGNDKEKNTSSALIFKYHGLKDFILLEKFAKDLNHSIQLPLKVLNNHDDDLNIQSIEEGSIILTISFGTGLLVVTKLIDLAFRYKIKWEEAKRVEEYNKSLSLDNNLKEAVIDAIKKQVKTYLQTEAEILTKEIIEDRDNEKVEIVKNSIYTLNSLLNQGLIIKPSINTPPEIKEKFKEFSSLNSSNQKKLNESNEETNQSLE